MATMETSVKDKAQVRVLTIVGVAALLVFAFCISAFQIYNLDIHWHLKTGEWILSNNRVPRTDFFSFSREGMEWIDAQWLFQVLAFAVLQWTGEQGLTLLVVILVEAILLVILFTASKDVPWGARCLVGVFFLLAMNPRIICRPELLTCLYMALFILLLEKGKERTRLLLFIPLIQVLWVNSQGLWPIGPVIVAAYACDTLVVPRLRKEEHFKSSLFFRQGGLFLVCLLAGLAQPYFIKGSLFPLTLLREVTMESTQHKKTIVDIQPIYTEPLVLRAAIPFVLFSTAAFVLSLCTGRRIRPALLLLSLAFIYLAVTARRNVSIGSVMAAGLLMVHAGAIFRNRWIKDNKLTLNRLFLIFSIGLCLVFSVLSQEQKRRTWDATFKYPGFGFRDDFYAEGVARTLKEIGYKGNIINSNRIGGYMIWSGWPDWKVFADPRMELGGEEALRQRSRVMSGGAAFREVVEDHKVEAVALGLWKEYLQALADRLYTDPDWALIYMDRPSGTALFLKRTPEWKSVIRKREIKLEQKSRQ